MRKQNAYTLKRFKAAFAKMMETTSIPTNMSSVDSINLYSNIFSFVEPNIPSRLFRFRKCSLESFISFEQNTVSVCAANSFPDRYDSVVYYDHKSLFARAKNSIMPNMPVILQAYRNYPALFPVNPFTTYISELVKTNKTDNEIIEVLWKEFEKLLAKWDENAVKQEQWARSNKATKLACFTENIKSKFMWDTYADGYSGFALEYDFRDWRLFTTNIGRPICLFPIIYSTKKIDATDIIDRLISQSFMLNSSSDEAIINKYNASFPVDRLYWLKVYLYKDKYEYAHEKEWRLIDIDESSTQEANMDYSSIPDLGCMKAIYYGPCMEQRYKEHLSYLAQQKRIKEYDIVLNTNSRKYGLKVMPHHRM